MENSFESLTIKEKKNIHIESENIAHDSFTPFVNCICPSFLKGLD